MSQQKMMTLKKEKVATKLQKNISFLENGRDNGM